ncbi:hypothetical protein MDOR_34760 [Mycolicibacterium doricum]|uniref:Uncharacterized protein n=1 Tax=Mycolicibacterium doricum TaxID=126673 RepID=A0A7I7VWT9_9MYCO|nr:hypothetical protein MDOR_34760 [Mycolicibacterium doricum]
MACPVPHPQIHILQHQKHRPAETLRLLHHRRQEMLTRARLDIDDGERTDHLRGNDRRDSGLASAWRADQ